MRICPERHETHGRRDMDDACPSCSDIPWQQWVNPKVGVVLDVAGRRIVVIDCSACKSQRRPSHAAAKAAGLDVPNLPVIRTNQCQLCSGAGCWRCTRQCERCKNLTTDIHAHHLAPWHLFGDANCWPMINLCVPCHRSWHAWDTPRASHKKFVKVSSPGDRDELRERRRLRRQSEGFSFIPIETPEDRAYRAREEIERKCARCWHTGKLFRFLFGPSNDGWPIEWLCARCFTTYMHQLLSPTPADEAVAA